MQLKRIKWVGLLQVLYIHHSNELHSTIAAILRAKFNGHENAVKILKNEGASAMCSDLLDAFNKGDSNPLTFMLFLTRGCCRELFQ